MSLADDKKKEYNCEFCEYKTNNKKDLKIHKKNENHILNSPKKIYSCPCGKKYKHTTSLSSHKKLCSSGCIFDIDSDVDNTPFLKEDDISVVELTTTLDKQNDESSEFENNIIPSKNSISVTFLDNDTIHVPIPHVNTKFHLNRFINEKCNDAINFSDFVGALKITYEDFENFGKYGFAEGISRIFIKGLRELDITKRPLHCSVTKVIYIRINDKWHKEEKLQDDNNMLYKDILKKAIKNIAYRNTKLIPGWKEANPLCMDGQSKINTKYMQILMEAMGGYTQEEDEINYQKIIKKIIKEVMIDKTKIK